MLTVYQVEVSRTVTGTAFVTVAARDEEEAGKTAVARVQSWSGGNFKEPSPIFETKVTPVDHSVFSTQEVIFPNTHP